MDGHFIDLYVHHKNENIWKKSHKLKKKKKSPVKVSKNIYWVSQSLSKVVSQISTISAKKKKKDTIGNWMQARRLKSSSA